MKRTHSNFRGLEQSPNRASKRKYQRDHNDIPVASSSVSSTSKILSTLGHLIDVRSPSMSVVPSATPSPLSFIDSDDADYNLLSSRQISTPSPLSPLDEGDLLMEDSNDDKTESSARSSMMPPILSSLEASIPSSLPIIINNAETSFFVDKGNLENSCSSATPSQKIKLECDDTYEHFISEVTATANPKQLVVELNSFINTIKTQLDNQTEPHPSNVDDLIFLMKHTRVSKRSERNKDKKRQFFFRLTHKEASQIFNDKINLLSFDKADRDLILDIYQKTLDIVVINWRYQEEEARSEHAGILIQDIFKQDISAGLNRIKNTIQAISPASNDSKKRIKKPNNKKKQDDDDSGCIVKITKDSQIATLRLRAEIIGRSANRHIRHYREVLQALIKDAKLTNNSIKKLFEHTIFSKGDATELHNIFYIGITRITATLGVIWAKNAIPLMAFKESTKILIKNIYQAIFDAIPAVPEKKFAKLLAKRLPELINTLVTMTSLVEECSSDLTEVFGKYAYKAEPNSCHFFSYYAHKPTLPTTLIPPLASNMLIWRSLQQSTSISEVTDSLGSNVGRSQVRLSN